MNDKLNILAPQKRMFVLEYMKHNFNVSAASKSIRIGTSTGSGYLGELDVQEAIAEQMAARVERTQIDADWVLLQLDKMFNADVADIFTPGTNDLKPVHEWPETWRKMTTSIKIDDRYDKGQDKAYQVKDIKILDRLKTLNMIGKHTDVRAFTERIEITTDQDLTDRLMAGRKRANKRNTNKPEKDQFL